MYPARTNSYAATSPDRPAPTTITSTDCSSTSGPFLPSPMSLGPVPLSEQPVDPRERAARAPPPWRRKFRRLTIREAPSRTIRASPDPEEGNGTTLVIIVCSMSLHPVGMVRWRTPESGQQCLDANAKSNSVGLMSASPILGRNGGLSGRIRALTARRTRSAPIRGGFRLQRWDSGAPPTASTSRTRSA